ncbi:methionyl-tRNA synthetase [Coccidioides posadasii str. Silveira]|uniref:Probable methionine--tRNA ligase, mitochondrial n=2 Tax=Coccidioides TaxID=5500 RepID=E9D1W3_COCPS|nr:methionyl-tRNA synthetase [Coccidioides posadasii str. Silveira]KMU75747.1 methionyl-tRNA synthetase [Coccidioides immitis RMSCC 3703]QVM13358.1 methionyl-tRNA synthetase [Coccidioides posadasii str. Silveira]
MLDFGLRVLPLISRLPKSPRRPWQRAPCRRTIPLLTRRGVASASSNQRKPYYVTTPIFYVNASPHVGHLYTLVLADILKRWQVLLGNNDAQLLTGTDEHGIKIQQAAASHGLEPIKLCDQNCQTFKDLAQKANVQHDHFIRTTDPEHRDAVQYFWEMLDHRGYIYTAKHEGWYSVSDETFYPSNAVHATLDPATGRKIMSTIETGKEVEWFSETNYHFRLSAFKDRLLDFYRENPTFIRPKRYMDNIVQSVSSGLTDLSISRPVQRLTWGIRVPGDDTQTIYVWLDALINYLTYAGYPFTPGKENQSIWPANVHVVGKDILRFHCVYWPAFLMALDLPLPRQVLSHAHWTIGREKMSKSTGNVVNPMYALARFGVDPLRFYLAHDGGLSDDADYENAFVTERYKKTLQWGVGNLTSRLVRSKKWNVRRSIEWGVEGRFPPPSEADRKHQQLLEGIRDVTRSWMDDLNPRKAAESVVGIIHETNKYFQEARPWSMAEQSGNTEPTELSRVIYNTAESLRIAGILLQPFMPEKSARLLDMLGVAGDPEKRSFEAAIFGADEHYGVPLVELKKGTEATLFPPLVTEN